MKRFLSLLLAMLCFMTPAIATDASPAPTEAVVAPKGTEAPTGGMVIATPEIADPTADYTVAGKLLKQLRARSGFSGTLTLDIAAGAGKQGVSTNKPLVFNVDYIYARPTEVTKAEHRMNLSLMDGTTAQAAAHLQFQNGQLALQSDLLGSDWYAFAGLDGNGGAAGGEGVVPAGMIPADTAEPEPVDNLAPPASIMDAPAAGTPPVGMPESDGNSPLDTLGALKSSLLAQTGMPMLAGYALPLLLSLQDQAVDFSDTMNQYTTRIDLWIEGYRQNAVLDKLADGTTTMEVQYAIKPTAIKAQAKQMLLDLLADSATLSKLQALLGEKDAALYLNPNLQSFYFSAIDALPLSGDLTISRTVSLKGDTLALHLALPVYDGTGGNVILRYDRMRGVGDLPDDNKINIESDTRTLTLAYLEYSSMTDVNVMQGTFKSIDKSEKTQPIAVAFTAKSQETEGKDEQGLEFYEYGGTLALAPDTDSYAENEMLSFTATDIELKARFSSKELKAAATDMNATLTIGGEEQAQAVTVTLSGKSRKKWDIEPLPDTLVDISAMEKAELDALLPGLLARSGLVFLPYLKLPAENAATPGITPEVFATLAPPTVAP